MPVLNEKSIEYDWSTPPDATVERVLELFKEKRVEAVTVVENGKLEGIVTEGDLVRVFYERLYHRSTTPAIRETLLRTPVRQFMTVRPLHVAVGADAFDALQLMRKKNIRHLPLVRPDNVCVGIIERKTLLSLVLE